MRPRSNSSLVACRRACMRWCTPALVVLFAACAKPTLSPPAGNAIPAAANPGALSAAARGEVLSTEAWSYEDRQGKLITTESYRIFTTSTRDSMVDRLPVFLETALGHYSATLTALPLPPSELEVYVMANRPQWERLTKRFMGSDANPYLQIQRGGFAAEGRAILWDIGRRDTFAILAHEGWHQYTQRTFKDPLPVAIEEGLATYMEGFKWGGDGGDVPRFLPWANDERFGRLREISGDKAIEPLDRLLRSTPQELVSEDADAALNYYAQVWALIHYLNEGEGGKHRPALLAMVQDAVRGGLLERVRQRLGGRAASAFASRRRGVDVLSIYTGVPSERLDGPYRAFITRVVRVGAGEFISHGASPAQEPAPRTP